MSDAVQGPVDTAIASHIFVVEQDADRMQPIIPRRHDEHPKPSLLASPDFADEVWPTGKETEWTQKGSLLDRVVRDHLNYYSLESISLIGAGLGAAAIMAHTSIDGDLHAEIHWNVWHGGKRNWAERLHTFKILGNGQYTLPLFAGAWLTAELLDDVPGLEIAGEWGERSLRSVLIGAPSVLVMQRAIGSSRPGESSNGSEWSPFSDSNGVSGHAFMGAVPFLCAAKMSDAMLLKATFYVASIGTGLSRVADDDHYLSQAALGWLMAYAAAAAVERTQQADTRLTVFPFATGEGVGAAMEYRW